MVWIVFVASWVASFAACGPPTAVNRLGETARGVALSDTALGALVDTLLVGAPEVRRIAADSLERLDDPRVPAILLNRLRAPAYRYEASRALSQRGLSAGADSLLPGLADTNIFVRWSVATALGAQGVARAGSLLIRTLDDPAMAVRRAAALSLGQLADTTALPALLAHRHDPDEEVRAAVAEALGRFGSQSAPVLREMAEEDSGLVVAASLKALGNLGDAAAVPLVGVALLDGSVPVRMAASEALGRIGGPMADSLLLACALDDPIPLVREAAVRALARARPSLILSLYAKERTRESDAFVRGAWVEGLRLLSGDEAHDALLFLAENDVSPDVRRAARRALFVRERGGSRQKR